jgi:hypothetical protein
MKNKNLDGTRTHDLLIDFRIVNIDSLFPLMMEPVTKVRYKALAALILVLNLTLPGALAAGCDKTPKDQVLNHICDP